MNMALDEALLETVTVPTLRFYGWRRPSLSFGYFGLFAVAAHEGPERDIVRRWTGGGIVLHGADLTYSIILPREQLRDPPSPRISYRAIHDAIRQALSRHVEVALAPADAPKVSEACFANPVADDVLVGGRKIAGAAQRRTRLGLLHQGSIQCDWLPETFPEAFASALCARFERRQFPAALAQRAETIAQGKYATHEWLMRR